MDRARIERLEKLHAAACSSQFFVSVTSYMRELHEALPALLRLARAVADAPRVEMVQSWADKGGVYAELHTSDIITALGDLTDGTRVLLLRADAVDAREEAT